MPDKRPKRTGLPRYPWADWFRSGEFLLVRGLDFQGRTYSMAQQVRNAASVRRHNYEVHVEIADDERTIRVVARRRKRAASTE